MKNLRRGSRRLTCPQCGRRLNVALSPGTEDGARRPAQCRAGHELLVTDDGGSVRLVGHVGEER